MCLGKIISIGSSLASTVGVENPMRYRGYYYDTETGLYYLQSRYYNPDWGRFISQDEAQYHEGMTGAAANLYAYGNNNPVMNVDPDGHISLWNRLCYIGQAAWDIKQAAWVLFTFSFRGNSLYEAGVGYIARVSCAACYNIMGAQIGTDFLTAEMVAQQYPEAVATFAVIISCLIQVSSLIPNVFNSFKLAWTELKLAFS
jgi:RHS repeat-associated protein